MLSKVKFLSLFTCKKKTKKKQTKKLCSVLVKLPILAEMLFEWEDTSLNVCSNDVSVHVKVDPDEFALQKSNRSQVGKIK